MKSAHNDVLSQGILARVVQSKSGCTVAVRARRAAAVSASELTLTLSLNATLGGTVRCASLSDRPEETTTWELCAAGRASRLQAPPCQGHSSLP